ncbi:Propionyl-CoA:succinate CoA transferase [Rubripirellula obstinata]|uniref:Propionyl-CoA:succinate CoA transferase n=1 Tax=Rubripirellula obstinata TaxID=406547 RepID=A0A5B1CP84_9BACT|nr:succinate CoA transferase [Rubripirellula obstinata]KAA1262356.1 Propionyl-CoA:succinate CoA transferase [Rubripirellula obstinata]
MSSSFATLTAEEAAEFISNDDLVATSGFTPAGAAKAVPRALAERAKRLHESGQEFSIRLLTGASTGESLDDRLAEADAVSWRAPYQSSRALRQKINTGKIDFVDMHLSHLPQSVLFGHFGKINVAVVEATEVTEDGKVFLTTSVGASPTFLNQADKVIIELNRGQSRQISDMADILLPLPPPNRCALSLDHPLQRIGKTFAQVDPKKIVGIVETDQVDEMGGFSAPDELSKKIAGYVVDFLANELKAGRIPTEFLPLQSGVGNVANAVFEGIGESADIPDFYMYTEVLQPSPFKLLRSGRMLGASSCGLTLLPEHLQEIADEIDFYKDRIVLRPQEISNNPAIIRQLGVIALNTALEADIYGHVNSTHVVGQNVMNGIGGSGDFARNSYLSIFVCPSIAKGGKISTIVPMCSHVDHNEHTVNVLVTEQGLADLRGLAPGERAKRIIENCVHPMYRDYLRKYVAESKPGHIQHDLKHCFDLHQRLIETGDMLG